MQILVVVTHLLGTGHLRRSINLAQAFVADGHQVALISGGLPVPTFDTPTSVAGELSFHQLPPVCSDGTNFVRLLKPDLSPVDDAYLVSRQRAISALVGKIKPAILITELFPFGRRVLRAEFLELLNAAQSLPIKPVILSSVRDILAAPSSAEKACQTEAIVIDHYDSVLVHSDPDTVSLDQSWPVTGILSEKLHYTGYVAQSVPNGRETDSGRGEILVSAGGGSVGGKVYEVAIESARLSPEKRWRILIGGSNAASEVERLRTLGADTQSVVETIRPDFRELLFNCQCSVSMCGYNTAVDLLQTGTPGVLIPFDENGEQEQTIRARSLSRRTHFIMLPASELTPENLCTAVTTACCAGRFSSHSTQFGGAAETVRYAIGLARERH